MRHSALTAVVLARTVAFAVALAFSTAQFEGASPQERQTFEYFGVVLEIPEGYVGPVTTGTNVAFTIPGTVGVPTQTLGIQRIDTGRVIPKGTDDEEYGVLVGQISRMLDSVRRTRANPTISSPEPIRIGGVNAVRASWTGDVQGQPMNGRIYSFLSGTAIVFVVVQGPGHALDEKLKRAVAAVENAQVAR